jgi:hypothetical protein
MSDERAREVHEAMMDAPHDGEPFRQARAAIRAADATSGPRLRGRMVAMLRRLEWWGGSCPECATERYTGRSGEGMDEHLVPVDPPPHEPDCEFATLLRDLP